MKPIFIVPGRNCFRNLRLHLHSQVIGKQKVFGIGFGDFAQSQDSGEHGSGGMGEQSVHAVLGDRQLSVIKILDMDRQAIGEGREAWREFSLRSHHRSAPIRKIEAGDVLAKQFSVLGAGASKR